MADIDSARTHFDWGPGPKPGKGGKRGKGQGKRKAKAGLSVFSMKPTMSRGEIAAKVAAAIPGAAYDVSS